MTTEDIDAAAVVKSLRFVADYVKPSVSSICLRAAALIERLSTHPPGIKGWKLVPEEATPEMIEAHIDECCGDADEAGPERIRKCWSEMLATAPHPPGIEGWRPISTAGEGPVLIAHTLSWSPNEVFQCVCWRIGTTGPWQGGASEVPGFAPVAWHSLPPPPASRDEPTSEGDR